MENVSQYSIGAIVGAIIGFLIGRFWRIKSGGYLPIVGKDETSRPFGIIVYPETGTKDLIFRDFLHDTAATVPKVEIELRGPVTRSSNPQVSVAKVIPTFSGTQMTSVLTPPELTAGSIYIARLSVDGRLPDDTPVTVKYDYIILT